MSVRSNVTILLVAAAAACSDPVGVRGPHGEMLDTQVSAATGALGDSVEVTAIVSNPTGHELTLVYGSETTYAQAVQGSGTFGDGLITLTGPDTIAMPAGAQVALRPVTLHVLPAGVYSTPAMGSEQLPLTPGVYKLAACAWASEADTPGGVAWVPSCGQYVTFTVTE
jgi:hypothetical protein